MTMIHKNILKVSQFFDESLELDSFWCLTIYSIVGHSKCVTANTGYIDGNDGDNDHDYQIIWKSRPCDVFTTKHR